MSYFAAGFYTNSALIKEFENSFNDVVPGEIENDVLRIEEGASFLLNYGTNKVINDIVLFNKEKRSWLALLGTPLIKLPTEEEKTMFIERFFSHPKRTIINKIDGSFAILAYDGNTKTVFLATDYNNTIPIYYAMTPNGIFLSSHELQLARLLQPEINPLGFSMTTHLKLTWSSHTRFRSIHKLLPCQFMILRSLTDHSLDQYWCPSMKTQWSNNFDDAANRWLSLLKDTVWTYYECSKGKKVICDFTAGEDARLLLSQCHALGIPYQAQVTGLDNDVDVLIAQEAAKKTGFDLVVRRKHLITENQLLENATSISLMHDAYQDYFQSCTDFATNVANGISHYQYIKYCGAPGGEAFRGSYYLRGKALFPSSRGKFDHLFFVKMKYLLDFHPGLLRYPDDECRKTILTLIEEALLDVKDFPVGIRIDHLLRLFQTCNAGLLYKNPRYIPFATKHLTRSVYDIPPQFKRGGRLTKACTEILYPELAFVKTQKGVPTVKKTLRRTVLFIPEYVALLEGIRGGVVGRLFRWTDSNKFPYKWSMHGSAIMTLLSKPPYSEWFSSAKSMITGYLYNRQIVESLLADARAGSSKYVPVLGRIINQELACRWVYRYR